jgi:hypothetical protein
MKKLFTKNNKECYEYFSGVADLVEFVKNSPRYYDSYGRYSTDENDEDELEWHGGMTYEDALDKLENGDKELADEIDKVKVDSIITDKLTQKYLADIQGFIPHVPNAVLGLPQSMINIHYNRVNSNNKIINLVLDADCSCGVEADDYMKVSKLFFSVVDSIEQLGYRCSIYYSLASKFDKGKANWILKVKDSSEPFNRYKCAFILGSVAMFRRIGFRLTECLESGIADMCGYGHVLDSSETLEMINNNMKLLNGVQLKSIKVFRIYDYIGDSDSTIVNGITKTALDKDAKSIDKIKEAFKR